MIRAIVLGSSRGLGAELAKFASTAGGAHVTGFARKETALAALRSELANFAYHPADFASPTGQTAVARQLAEAEFNKMFIVAGGGPYGRFEDRAWKDHEWAWEVSFRFPALVLHTLLAAGKTSAQVIVVGSAVAEAEPDPMAGSYCAAKHALKGLVTSLQRENPSWDLRLFSPGYMDTDLLPKNAAARQRGVFSPAQIACELWSWSLTADKSAHKLYPKHPS